MFVLMYLENLGSIPRLTRIETKWFEVLRVLEDSKSYFLDMLATYSWIFYQGS